MIQYAGLNQALLPFDDMPVLTPSRSIVKQPASVTPRPSTIMEFFAGIGLVRYAFEKEGWLVKFANDIDPAKRKIYDLNFHGADFIPGDIKLIKAADLPEVTLATSSFPCTDVSLAGGRMGLKGEQSGAVLPFLDLMKQMKSKRPPLVLLENVLGLLSSHGGSDFRFIIRELNSLGYECDAIVVNAVHFIPQSRPRLFIFGVQNDISSPYVTTGFSAHLSKNELRPAALLDAIRNNDDLRWRFHGGLPSLPVPAKNLSDLLEQDLDDSQWWNATRTSVFIKQLSPLHANIIRLLKEKSRYSYGTAYRRMRPAGIRMEVRFDGVAGCLRTPRGGSSKQVVVRCGRGSVKVRFMTPREYARLQGVDDSYDVGDSTGAALFGFGDAVCVPAIRWVAKQYANPFVVTRK